MDFPPLEGVDRKTWEHVFDAAPLDSAPEHPVEGADLALVCVIPNCLVFGRERGGRYFIVSVATYVDKFSQPRAKVMYLPHRCVVALDRNLLLAAVDARYRPRVERMLDMLERA